MATKKTLKLTTKDSYKHGYSHNKLLIIIVGVFVFAFVTMIYKANSLKKLTQKTVYSVVTPFEFGKQTFQVNNQQINFMDSMYQNVSTVAGEQHTASISNRSLSASRKKAAAILIDSPGGSGTFYYVVGASSIDDKEVYSQPILLGDRVKIESVTVEDAETENNGMIVVEYLDRAANAAMSAEPTKKMTAKFAFQEDGNLILL